MRGINIFKRRDQLFAQIDEEESNALGFLVAMARRPKFHEQDVHLSGMRRALIANFRLVPDGFALRLNDAKSSGIRLFLNGESVAMVAVKVEFGRVVDVYAWQAEDAERRAGEVAEAEERAAEAQELRKERRRKAKQANRREEDIPPPRGVVRLTLNEKNVPMLRSDQAQAGVGKEMQRASKGDGVTVRLGKDFVAEIRPSETEGTLEILSLGNHRLEVLGQRVGSALIVVGQNPRRAERLEIPS